VRGRPNPSSSGTPGCDRAGPRRHSLHLADDVLALWHDVQIEVDDEDAALPYWAFAWGGGLASRITCVTIPGQ